MRAIPIVVPTAVGDEQHQVRSGEPTRLLEG